MPLRLEPHLEDAIASCSTGWLKNLLRKELPKVLEVKDTPAGHQQAQQWDALIKSKMVDRGLVSLRQQKNPITDVRRVIKAIDPNHPALQDVGFTPEEWTDINLPGEEAVAGRVAKPIENPDAISTMAGSLMASDEWSEIAAGVTVATGRRSAEVLKTAQFEIASKWSVWFTGALKRRSEPVTLRFEIPTLVEAERVVDAIGRLRTLVDTEGMDNRLVNRYFSNDVAQVCDRVFEGLVPPREGKDNLYTHLFRAVYGTIATFWFCPPSVPELEFRAAIQGHYKVLEEGRTELRRSLAAARHYFDYEIADGVIAKHGGRRKGVRLDEPGVKVLGEFRVDDVVEKEDKKMGLKRVLISEEDKEQVIEWQAQFAIASQDEAMGFVVEAAQKAFAIAELLDCDVEEVLGGVEEVLGQVSEGKAKLAEAERAISLIEKGGGGNQSVIEQSLAMANEFNGYLKQENEQLKQERGGLLSEVEQLRSRLAQFEAMQQQFQQFQQLFSGAAAAPVAAPRPAKTPEPVAVHEVAQNGTAATNTRPRSVDGRSSPDAEREINLIIDEIIQFNEQTAQDDEERWLINQSILNQLSTRSQSIIKRVLESRDDVQEHHDKYGMYGRRWNVGKDIEMLKTAIGLA
ncbi:MAG: protelomerase family protein [Cyanobacteria bacterium P01_D01_bin.44]